MTDAVARNLRTVLIVAAAAMSVTFATLSGVLMVKTVGIHREIQKDADELRCEVQREASMTIGPDAVYLRDCAGKVTKLR